MQKLRPLDFNGNWPARLTSDKYSINFVSHDIDLTRLGFESVGSWPAFSDSIIQSDVVYICIC